MQERNSRSRRTAQRVNRRKKKLGLIIGCLILLLLMVAGGILLWNHFSREDDFERYQFDTDAIAGRIQMMTEEEIQQELNRVVEEGMFNISIASSILFESPETEGEARIENIAANRYHMQVDILLDDTQERVYASKLIRPGYAIEKIRLDKRLKPGEYNATAVFKAITQEEMQLFGVANAKIKLYIADGNGRIPTPTPQPTAAAMIP